MKKIILYNNYMSMVGGIETFVYNFCMQLRNDYDITILVERIPEVWVERLRELVNVETDMEKTYECDTLVMLRIPTAIPENVKYKKVIRRIHSRKFYDIQEIPQDADLNVCVSKSVKDDFDLKDAVIINNLSYITAKKTLLLMSCTRIPAPDKGENVERMRILCRKLEEAQIPFLWLNFSDNELEDAPHNFINVGSRLDVQNYMQKADYIVQLSSIESFGNTVLEALTLNVPLICTPVSSFFEIGVMDGINAHVVPFDMDFDAKELLDIPKFSFSYDNEGRIRQWKEVL